MIVASCGRDTLDREAWDGTQNVWGERIAYRLRVFLDIIGVGCTSALKKGASLQRKERFR